MSEKKEDDYITIRIPRELSDELDRLIGKKGFRSKAEIVKNALREFLEHYEADTQFKMLNHDERGVKIWDNKLPPNGGSARRIHEGFRRTFREISGKI